MNEKGVESTSQEELAKKRTPCEVYSRQQVVGYYSRIDNWNNGKREEYKDRKMFNN